MFGGIRDQPESKGKEKAVGACEGGAEQARGAAFLDRGPGWGVGRETRPGSDPRCGLRRGAADG